MQPDQRAIRTNREHRQTRLWFVALTCGAIWALGGAAQAAGAADGGEGTAPASASSSDFRFDFPGVQVGVGEYDDGPTGATVILFSQPVVAAVDVRGGSPGTSRSDKR